MASSSPFPRWTQKNSWSPNPIRPGPQPSRSPSPKRWAPRRSRSPSPSPNPSPTGPLFSPQTVDESGGAAAKGLFPFSSFSAAPPPTRGRGRDNDAEYVEISIDLESPGDTELAAAVIAVTSSHVPNPNPNLSRSRSPSPSPSPSSTEGTPSAIPTPRLLPRENVVDDDDEYIVKGGSGGSTFGRNPTLRTRAPPPMHHDNEEVADSVEFGMSIAAQMATGAATHGGVFLTWEDLWVTASDGHGGRSPILCGLTGYARPGEVLAIMGPSGCGKSTLLDTLAGRLGSNVTKKGSILLNGQKQTLSFGTSAYVTQDDVLMATLTVREAVCYSAQLQLPGSMTSSEKRERAEETIREMGLGGAMDTRIGGWGSKGISGGQKRRVSICMEILTRPPLLFLDEPTSGLDSAASYHVMSRIAGLARREGMTVVASIHQPSSEVFELFNALCLLANGRTVWFGPPSLTSELFALNGFPCPTLRNPSDHYLRTINKDFDKDIEEGLESKPTTTAQVIEMLVKSYTSSFVQERVLQDIVEICKMGGAPIRKGSQANFFTQSLVLTQRSFMNMYRDLGYYWLRLAIYISLCLCVGTIYHDIGKSFGSIQARGSMLMFVAAFLTFMAIGGFPSFVEDMKIFGRERLNGHYGVTAFVIGNTISSVPYLLLISLVPGAIAYYLVGLQRGIDHFAYFALVLFMCMMVVEGLMMIVASIVPDFLMGIITGAGIQGVMMLNGGFFRLPEDLPKPVWRYPMYYVAFHKYANQGFYKNEFLGLTFPNNQAGGAPTITGVEILRNTWEVEMGYSKWVDLAILFGMVIIYRVLFLAIVKLTEKAKPKLKALFARTPKKVGSVMQQP